MLRRGDGQEGRHGGRRGGRTNVMDQRENGINGRVIVVSCCWLGCFLSGLIVSRGCGWFRGQDRFQFDHGSLLGLGQELMHESREGQLQDGGIVLPNMGRDAVDGIVHGPPRGWLVAARRRILGDHPRGSRHQGEQEFIQQGYRNDGAGVQRPGISSMSMADGWVVASRRCGVVLGQWLVFLQDARHGMHNDIVQGGTGANALQERRHELAEQFQGCRRRSSGGDSGLMRRMCRPRGRRRRIRDNGTARRRVSSTATRRTRRTITLMILLQEELLLFHLLVDQFLEQGSHLNVGNELQHALEKLFFRLWLLLLFVVVLVVAAVLWVQVRVLLVVFVIVVVPRLGEGGQLPHDFGPQGNQLVRRPGRFGRRPGQEFHHGRRRPQPHRRIGRIVQQRVHQVLRQSGQSGPLFTGIDDGVVLPVRVLRRQVLQIPQQVAKPLKQVLLVIIESSIV